MTEQRLIARPIQLGDANLYDITGPIVVNYSRNSIAGVPLLSYSDAELSLNFSGTEIAQVDTTVGEVVTVTLQDVSTPLSARSPWSSRRSGSGWVRRSSSTPSVSRPSIAAWPSFRPLARTVSCRPTGCTICTGSPSGSRSRRGSRRLGAVSGVECGPGRARRPAVGGPDPRSSGRD